MANNTNSQIGSQVALAYGNGASPQVYTSLGPVRSIAGIGLTRPEVDSTTLDSTAVERIGGLQDGKQVTIVFTAANANAQLIKGFVDAGTAIRLRVTFPSPLNESRYFNIIPLDYDHGTITASGLLELTLMGRITGAISASA